MFHEDYTVDLELVPAFFEKGVDTQVSATYTITPNQDEITIANLNGITNLNIEGVESSVVLDTVDQSFDATLTITYNTIGEEGAVGVHTYRADALNPKWWGASSSSDYSTYTSISSELTKIIDEAEFFENYFTSVNNKYIWFIYEKTGEPEVYDQNGFKYDIGNWSETTDNTFVYKTITLTLADGTSTADVTLVRSSQPMTFYNITLTVI